MRRHLLFIGALALSSTTAAAQKIGPTTEARVTIEVDGVMIGYGRSLKSGNVADAPSGPRNASGPPMRDSRTTSSVNKQAEFEVDGIPVMNTTSQLVQWANDVRSGRAQPRNVRLTVMSAAGTPVMQYSLVQAVPSKLAGPSLRAGSSSAETMDVTFTSQAFTVSGGGSQ